MSKKKYNEVIYPNAPLVETVFEIKFQGEPSIECHRDLFYDKIRKGYPSVYVPNAIDGQALSLEPYRFIEEDKTSGFMVALNSLAFFTRKYKGFNLFKKKVLHYFQIFQNIYKINKLNRTGLRYINIIPFLREDDQIFPIDRYLKVNLKLSETITDNFKYLQLRFITQTKGGTITTNIQPFISQDNRGEAILLDFDYAKCGNLSYNNINAYLDESHRHTKLFFESLITEEYRSIMKGEVI